MLDSPLETLEKAVGAASAFLADMESRALQDDRFSELSVRQMFYLNTILRLGHPTFSDLARQLDVSRPSVTGVVTLLIRKGYVQKQQDDEDMRSYHIVPTPRALEFDEIHSQIHARMARRMAANLDDVEIGWLAGLLQKAFQTEG
jgi:DNA-binding MarR family transcriptional regulator